MFGKRSLLPLFILVALVMSACGGSNNAATSTKFSGTIHIASSTWTGYALIYLANAKGIWKNHGLDVNFKDVEDPNVIESGLVSNAPDLSKRLDRGVLAGVL